MNPMISIIIPVFNSKKYLRECLDSVVQQTYKHIEIIIVDDGSTDQSREVYEVYVRNDCRIKVLVQHHMGAIKARNYGISVAEGDYIGFVDSDDWIDETMYESMVNMLEPDTDIIGCGYVLHTLANTQKNNLNAIKAGTYENEMLGQLYSRMMYDFEGQCPGVIQALWSKLFKKEVIQKYVDVLDGSITLGDDAALVYPCMLNAKKISLMDDCLYHYRIRAHSLCRTKDIKIFERLSCFFDFMQHEIAIYPKVWQLEKQLKMYMIHLLQTGIRELYSIDFYDHYVIPDELMISDLSEKIVLYGAGNVGKSYYTQLEKRKGKKIVGWVDRSVAGKSILGKSIQPPEDMNGWEYDRVIIATENETTANEIKDYLLSQNINEEKIVWKKPEKEIFVNNIDLRI